MKPKFDPWSLFQIIPILAVAAWLVWKSAH
jgi:hypothetical protein